MTFQFVQPYPDHSCKLRLAEGAKAKSPVPVYYVRHRYAHHAMSSGYDRLCDYVAGREIRLSKSLYWLGETLLRLPAIGVAKLGGHFEYSRYDFVMELDVLRHFLRHRNSVYHFVYGEKSYNLLSHFAGRNGNKIVVTIHHPPEHNEWLFRSLDHFRKVDFATVVSRNQVAYWEGIIGKDRVAYVPYAVDADYFRPIVEFDSARHRRCLFLGYHERDFDALKRLVPALLSARSDLEFTMISSDSRCGDIAASQPRARWLRRVGDVEYLRQLQESDVLVFPLRQSTTCTAVLEALACGLPVITNTGGIEDYLDGECSVVLPVGDVNGMLTATLGLLEDESRRSAMSKAARKRACQFSWTATARIMTSVYARLMHP